ncbi:RodZ domain-containing protein [Ferrimonas marina]|uniref:Cytoskeleton protein RodZ n=1 Tax=Ferrimonas marina TaxID=299255 RepID=A0A1M5S3P2_9GAMM|nr:RodZ domain-containing protein [Ferrimonas marina]SHH33252.1 cytoskeleton protein RodZ [Ferrimonas marina]
MTDEQQNDASPELVETPGPMLRQARERAGLTTTQVAQRLNLRHSVVVGMEQDSFEPDMSITYIRGYIRNYARLVGLDEQRLNDALDRLHQPEPTKEMQSFSGRTHREKHDSRWMMLTWVILLALAVVIIWGLFGRSDDSSDTVAPPTVTIESPSSAEPQSPSLDAPTLEEPAVEAPSLTESSDAFETAEPEIIEPAAVQRSEPAQPEPSLPAQSQSQSDELASSAAQPVTAPSAAEPVAEAAEESAPAVASEDSLSIRLSADCWMLVQDANGRVLVEGLKSDGYQTDVQGEAPFSIRLGAPEAANLVFNGDQVDLSGFRPGRVARLTLPQ